MLKTAICYFSGSGNSFDLTLEMCKQIDVESIFYIPNIKMDKLSGFDEIIIVSPVYQFNIPKNVQDFLRALKNDKRYFVVLSYSGILGKSKSTVKKLFNQNRLKLAGIRAVRMPTSNSPVFRFPDSVISSMLKSSTRKARNTAKYIHRNENKNISLKRAGRIKRYIPYSVISNDLSVSAKCTQCQQCISYCPTDNIQLYQGKIEFGDKCIGCLACYNRCEHVLYKHKKGKVYINPNVDLKLMK